ncbi:MAG: hypothetical protein RL149_949 [Actinomycetota bacterium]|jgi:tight adherence protein C
MKNIAYLVALLSLVLSILLMRIAGRKQTLLTRVRNLAPGAGLASELEIEKPTRAHRMSSARRKQVDLELPDLIELLACSMLAGSSLHAALQRVCERSAGLVSQELTLMLRKLEFGAHFDQELSALCERLPNAGIREFANKLSLALARGTPLAGSLVALSQSLRKKQSVMILAKAGSNETKMLIPLVALVLPTTVIFATYPSIQFLSFGFN